VATERFRRYAPEIQLSPAELNDVRHILAQMLTV
jgi:ribosomal protein L29